MLNDKQLVGVTVLKGGTVNAWAVLAWTPAAAVLGALVLLAVRGLPADVTGPNGEALGWDVIVLLGLLCVVLVNAVLALAADFLPPDKDLAARGALLEPVKLACIGMTLWVAFRLVVLWSLAMSELTGLATHDQVRRAAGGPGDAVQPVVAAP